LQYNILKANMFTKIAAKGGCNHKKT